MRFRGQNHEHRGPFGFQSMGGPMGRTPISRRWCERATQGRLQSTSLLKARALKEPDPHARGPKPTLGYKNRFHSHEPVDSDQSTTTRRRGILRTLVLDPFQHYPSVKRLLEYQGFETVYATSFSEELMRPHALLHSYQSFSKKYFSDAIPVELLLNGHEKVNAFDLVLVVFPVISIAASDEAKFADAELFQAVSRYASEHRTHSGQLVLVDNHDYPHDPTAIALVSDVGFDCILKREYHRDREYDERVRPFPYVIFGQTDPISLVIDQPWRRAALRSKAAFWLGYSFTFGDDILHHYVNRAQVLSGLLDDKEASSHINIVQQRLPFRFYMQLMRRHHFFLHLNGLGNMTKRLFEGLSVGSSPLMERFTVRFPDQHQQLEEALKAVSFSSPSEFTRAYDLVRSKPVTAEDLLRTAAASLSLESLSLVLLESIGID